MKLYFSLFVCVCTTMLNLLALSCNALPIIVNFTKEPTYRETSINPSNSVIDIYAKVLLSTEKQPAFQASSFDNDFLRPNSITLSNPVDNLQSQGQSVFLDVDLLNRANLVKEEPTSLAPSDRTDKENSRIMSWLLPSLRKRNGKLNGARLKSASHVNNFSTSLSRS